MRFPSLIKEANIFIPTIGENYNHTLEYIKDDVLDYAVDFDIYYRVNCSNSEDGKSVNVRIMCKTERESEEALMFIGYILQSYPGMTCSYSNEE